MGYQDIFTLITNAIQHALGDSSALLEFRNTGITLWGIFASIIVMFFGVDWAFSPSSINGARVIRLIMQLLICKTILLLYVTPLYGSDSFTGIIIKEANYITNTLGQANYDQIAAGAATLDAAIPETSPLSPKSAIIWCTVVILAALINALVFVMAAFGFIVQAILLLLGPLFIPFYIVPTLDFLAWNWFKSFLQYSMYGVIGNAFAYIYTLVAVAMFQQIVTFLMQPNSDAAAAITGLFVLLILGIVGVLQIPSIVSHLFSGQSGANPGGMVSSVAVSTAASAATNAAKAAAA